MVTCKPFRQIDALRGRLERCKTQDEINLVFYNHNERYGAFYTETHPDLDREHLEAKCSGNAIRYYSLIVNDYPVKRKAYSPFTYEFGHVNFRSWAQLDGQGILVGDFNDTKKTIEEIKTVCKCRPFRYQDGESYYAVSEFEFEKNRA